MTVFDRYLEQAKDFARRLVRTETGTRRWATVTSVDPVRITYDGTTTQGIISPVVLGTPVTIGDRVRAHTIHDRTYIIRANPTGAGWVSITLAAGYSDPDPIRIVREGRLAVMRGQLQRNSGSFSEVLGQLLFTVPAGFRPVSYVRVPIASYSGTGAANYYLAVTTAGRASLGRMGDGAGADVYLTGVSWPIF